MIEAMFDSSNYQTSKALLDVTAARHQAIAGNIANVHTPGYQRMDVSESFMDKLQSAIGKRDVSTLGELGTPEIIRAKGFEAQDASGNNVNLEKEMMLLGENSFSYEMNAQFVSGSIRRLETAITGRVS